MLEDFTQWPGYQDLVLHLGKRIAGEGWHTFTMQIEAAPEGEPVWVESASLVPSETGEPC